MGTFGFEYIFSSEEIAEIMIACTSHWSIVKDGLTNLDLYEIRKSAKHKIGVHAKMSAAMEKHIKHERNRWAEFGRSALFVRLEKIINPYKLRAFIIMAQEHQSDDLYEAACRRARRLGYGWIIPRSANISKLSLDLKKPKPMIRKIKF